MGQEYNENASLVQTPFILHGELVGLGFPVSPTFCFFQFCEVAEVVIIQKTI
jgi:hypothetical protein